MQTDDLIKVLAAAGRRPMVPLSSVWWGAAAVAIALAGTVFLATLDLRPDLAAAAHTAGFLFKVVFAITLAGSAFGLMHALSRPGGAWRRAVPYACAAPALLATAVIIEAVWLPPGMMSAKMIGTNSLACLAFIPLIGLGPLAVFLMVLRYGAPTRPVFAGAVAGLSAGGIAAAFYAAHCPDDSPLFVATWYTAAIAGLAIVGGAAARCVVRW